MPRKSRIHYSQAMYHVMNQGNYRQRLFWDANDYDYAYKLLERVVKNYGCKIHLFCLMTNHIHLVVEVNEVPLSKIMQSFSATYSKYLNKKMDRRGHLFRGRYRDKLIQDEKYLLELCYYIHNNPLNANIVKTLDAYPWSSHHCYAQKQFLEWVTVDTISNLLKKQVKTFNSYHDFMTDREENYTEPKFCLLNEDGQLIIRDSINAVINSSKSLDLRFLSLKQIIDIICDRLDVPLHLIQSDSRRESVTLARTLATYFAHYHGRYTLIQIAQMLGARADSLSKIMQRQFSNEKKKLILKTKIKFLSREFLDVSLRIKRSDVMQLNEAIDID